MDKKIEKLKKTLVLLELLDEYLAQFGNCYYTGFCFVIETLKNDMYISEYDSEILKYYILANMPFYSYNDISGLPMYDFGFEPANWDVRNKWLKNEIKQLKSKLYEPYKENRDATLPIN